MTAIRRDQKTAIVEMGDHLLRKRGTTVYDLANDAITSVDALGNAQRADML